MPRPYARFQAYVLFRYGETKFSACTFQVALATGISNAIDKPIEKTKQNKNKISGSMGSENHRGNQTKQEITIPGSMGNQNHRENQEHQDFRINGYQKSPGKPNKNQENQDFRTNGSGSRSLVLKSWFSCFWLVFPTAFDIHWHLGVLGFLYGFGYPLILES